MLILSGIYDMAVGYTADLNSAEPVPVIDVRLGAGSTYHMADRHTWHRVIPRTQCYSLMVNGPRWENAHSRAPSTGGKGLEAMTPEMLSSHLERFRDLLGTYLAT